MRKRNNIFIIVSFLAIVFLSFWIYKDSVSAYFFQDDWFSLRISQAQTKGEFFSFFLPRPDVIYYRPLGMQVPFFFLQKLFGVNPLPFHLVQLFTHALNSILVYILVRRILKKDTLALLSSFLYATSSIHYIPFYWFSTFAFVLGPTFFFSSYIFFLLFSEKGKHVYFFLSLLLFTTGLFVNEMIIVAPFIFGLYIFIFNKKEAKKTFFLLPYGAVDLSFFILRFFIFPAPTSGLYSMTMGKHVANNLEAYFLWSFNWPEEMKAQLLNFMTVNPEFIKGFSHYYFTFVSSLLFFIVLWYIIPFILILVEKRKTVSPFIGFGLSWFIIGLLPVVFFPHHTFSYYLPISFVGFLIWSLTMLDVFLKKVEKTPLYIPGIVSIMTVWILVSMTTIDFNKKVHWAPRRAQQAKLLIERAKQYYYPSLQNLDIYVYPTSENKLSLNDQDAFKVIFANEKIVTHYTIEEEAKEVL